MILIRYNIMIIIMILQVASNEPYSENIKGTSGRGWKNRNIRWHIIIHVWQRLRISRRAYLTRKNKYVNGRLVYSSFSLKKKNKIKLRRCCKMIVMMIFGKKEKWIQLTLYLCCLSSTLKKDNLYFFDIHKTPGVTSSVAVQWMKRWRETVLKSFYRRKEKQPNFSQVKIGRSPDIRQLGSWWPVWHLLSKPCYLYWYRPRMFWYTFSVLFRLSILIDTDRVTAAIIRNV